METSSWHSRHFTVTVGKLSGTLKKHHSVYYQKKKNTLTHTPVKLENVLTLLLTCGTHFPTLSYTSTQEIPPLLNTQSLKKGLPGKGHYDSESFLTGESIYWYSCIWDLIEELNLCYELLQWKHIPAQAAEHFHPLTCQGTFGVAKCRPVPGQVPVSSSRGID